jgi:hypothetical protein
LRAPLERLLGDFFAAVFAAFAGAFLALFFSAGPLVDFFAEDFFTAGFLADDARFAEDLRAGDRLAVPFFADLAPPRAFGPLRFFPVLPPDFVRDFLARVAMILLLGVGGEIQNGG